MAIGYYRYRVFYYVAKCQNITQAATLLMSNQPNVTRAIKKLEEEFGCILFVRSRRGVHLTADGERLFAHVRIAFEHIETAEVELAARRKVQGGMITVGASDIALRCMLLPILKAYRGQYPDVRIRVSNASTPQALSALRDGLVDVAVITTHTEIDSDLQCCVIGQVRDAVVCGAAFSRLVGTPLSFRELAEHPLVCLGEHTQTYSFYSELFLSRGIPFSPAVEAASADRILPLVMHDLGIGFVPEVFLEPIRQNDSLLILQTEEPIPARNICLVTRKESSLGIAAKKLEEMILAKSAL